MIQKITLKDGAVVAVAGKSFTVDGLQDIPFFVHRPIGLGTGWVVTEPITGARVLSHAERTQELAIEAAKRRCEAPGAKEYVRNKVAAAQGTK